MLSIFEFWSFTHVCFMLCVCLVSFAVFYTLTENAVWWHTPEHSLLEQVLEHPCAFSSFSYKNEKKKRAQSVLKIHGAPWREAAKSRAPEFCVLSQKAPDAQPGLQSTEAPTLGGRFAGQRSGHAIFQKCIACGVCELSPSVWVWHLCKPRPKEDVRYLSLSLSSLFLYDEVFQRTGNSPFSQASCSSEV